MGRPKSFDVDEVLEQAMEVFWVNGLAATSVEDLVNHLGINRGSLYATFNSKEELYHRALDRYHADSMTWLGQVVGPDDRPLRSRLHDLLVAGTTNDGHRGCFMMNTAIERNSVDESCRSVTADAINDMIGVLAGAVEQAQVEGGPGNRLVDDLTSPQAANFLITSLQGLRAMATMGAGSADTTDASITLILDALFGPAD